MKTRVLSASIAALLGLVLFERAAATAADVPVRTAVYTRISGTPAPACTLDLPLQIPSNLQLPIQVPGAAAVIPAGSYRRYGGYYPLSYRGYYRPHYAPYYAPYYAYRPWYLYGANYAPYGYGYGWPYFYGGLYGPHWVGYYGSPLLYGGYGYGGYGYGGYGYGGYGYGGCGYGGCYHW
jgi:hypothetical protein